MISCLCTLFSVKGDGLVKPLLPLSPGLCAPCRWRQTGRWACSRRQSGPRRQPRRMPSSAKAAGAARAANGTDCRQRASPHHSPSWRLQRSLPICWQNFYSCTCQNATVDIPLANHASRRSKEGQTGRGHLRDLVHLGPPLPLSNLSHVSPPLAATQARLGHLEATSGGHTSQARPG